MLILIVIFVIIGLFIAISNANLPNDNKIGNSFDTNKIIDELERKRSECFDFSEMFIEKNGELVKIKKVNSERIEVAGIHIGRRKNVCMSCYLGEELDLVRTPSNKFDINAIKIMRKKSGISDLGFNYGLMGHIPANISSDISPKMKSGIIYRAFFEEYEESEGFSSYCNAYISLIEYEKIS